MEKKTNKITRYTSREAVAEGKKLMDIAKASPMRAIEYLGGKGVLQGTATIKEKEDLIPLIKKGIPRKSLDNLLMVTGISPAEMAGIMHTSDRTLRRYKPSKLLNAEQSEKVIQLALLYSRGEEVFESLEGFKTWMESTVIPLGNKPPKVLLDTSIGIEILMDELGRIEQGVFA
jgi:putative toxin-antitoxin system antitoxin component (TIGR02293 family)